MTRQQRILVGVLGGLVALLAVVVAIAAATKDNGATKVRAAATSSTSSSLNTSTTIELQPVDTAPPTTAAAPGSTTTSSTPPTTAKAPPVVTGDGAVLTAPASPSTRGYDGSSCQQLADPAPWTATCDVFNQAKSPALIWMVESRPAGGRRAAVWRVAGAAGAWVPILQAKDDDGSRFSDIKVRVAALVGDGGEEAAFGFHQSGSGAILAIDVVRGPGKVVVHRDLAHGSARVSPGQLDTWSAVFAAGEPSCCPSKFQHDVIRYTTGAFRIVSSELVEPAAVPPSQL